MAMYKLRYWQTVPVVVLSAITSTLTLASFASAATFAGVSSVFEFSNFSRSPLTTATDADTDTISIALGGGSAIAKAEAAARFNIPLALAGNEIISTAEGNGYSYLGLAQSQASISGVFELAAQETLSFDFKGVLTLAAAIDDSNTEFAFALGRLGFALFGETASQPEALLDSLDVFATLTTPGNGDIYEFLIAGNPGSLAIEQFERQTGGPGEFLNLRFKGRYSRTFKEPTLVSLVETKTGVAEVQAVPTPSLIWGIMTYGGLGFVRKLRQRVD
ncbi:MAG: hypothetical protein HC929_00720 [Leptolyngbyaceae cyanobacterium SM2_5_2]|nr:hypothetical protein [Leptolyngbyaceae cyanobacterium SM2_5_2]